MTMKYKYILFLGMGILLFSCKGNKKEASVGAETDPRVDVNMVRTKQDTLTLHALATAYLDLLKQKDFDQALQMLFEQSGDSVVPLSETGRKEQAVLYKNFPVVDYKIESLSLYSETDTELRYTVTLFEKAENDDRPNSMKFLLTPRRVKGEWKLMVQRRAVNR